MFDNLFKSAAPVKTPTSGGTFKNLFPTIPAAKPTAISTPSSLAPLETPATTISPSTTPNAFANTLGSGYGASNETDSSGKPLLTFINQPAKSSQLLSDRVAPTSNPTVAKPNAVQTTPRMSVASSTAIRSNLGMGTGTELDHIQPLELGGSNEKSNLRPESAVNPSKPYSGANETATDPIENAITAKVNAGKESEAQGWADMAKAKGITLPENGGSVPNINQTQPNLGGNAPQPSLASKVGGFFGGLFDKAKSAGSAVVSGVENAAQTAKDAGLSYLAGEPISTRKQTPSNSLVFNASPDAITALTTGKNAPVPAAGPASPLQFATDLPKNIVQGATRSALGFGKTLLGEDQPSQPGEINASKLSPIEQLATYGKEPVSPLVDSATVAAAKKGNPKALGGLGLAGLGLGANVTLDPGTWGDDTLAKLAQETDAEKIVSTLTAKGVEEDGARSIAPILARAQTPEQVKAVLQTAANRGIIMNGAKDAGTTAADEFAAQKGGEAAAEDTTPKALSAPASNEISKDLQPLADEAKKYPTAQEFSDAIIHDKGGVGSGVEYSPAKRLVETGINDTPLTNFGFKPEDKVTIYRGVDRASQKAIAPGDYIATSYDLAKSYTGGKVISQEVPASTVRFASSDGITPNDFRKGFNETHLEGVYNPTAPLKATQLEDFYNKATGKAPSPTSLAPEVPRPPVKTTPPDNTIKENFLNRVRETASPTEFEKNAKGLGKEKVPEVQTDEQSLAESGAKTVAGKGTKVGGLDKDTRKIYQDWANYRGQSNKAISGRMASAPFESLRKSGMDAVHAFQDGDRSGQLEAVDKWGKTLLAKEQEAGIPVESRANYLPQYWANSEAEIKAAQDKFVNDNPGKRVSLTPGFSREATFPDYKTGEEYGLTPKYNNIPDMINARVRASEQALADRALFDNLAKHNLVVPSSRAPEGWKTLNPDKFPRFPINAGGQVFHGTVSAPGPLADLINAQLRGTESQTDRIFQATAKWATKLKTVVLGSGIPGTAIQFHAFNELAATVPELFNQPTLFTTALQYMFHPNSAEGFINANLPMAQEAARSGLVLGGEEIALDSLAQQAVNKGVVKTVAGLFQKGEDLLYKVFAKNTFEKMVPALKLRMWADTKDFLIDQGMNATDAARNAANRANQTFGGLNYAALGRDPNLQNMIRTFIFAPDFWEARFKYAGNMGKGLVGKGPMSKLYRNAALTVLGAYVAMNVANKKTSGKWIFQNPAGHSMDIYGGTDSAGKNIWIRPFGTDLDFARLPMDIAQSIVQTGDLSGIGTDARNRVSTLLQPILTLVTNSDAYGNKIFQPATTANPLWGQIATFASTLPVVPQVGVGIAGLFTPGTSKEEAISKAAGLPVKFNSPTTPTTSQLADMIYTERPQLESEIKKDYLAGNTSDAYNKMAQFNQDLVNVTIKAYQDNGHTITDRQAFINFLATHTQAEGGLKGLLVMPPTQKVMNTAKQKQGQPLFNKIFPSNITSSTQ